MSDRDFYESICLGFMPLSTQLRVMQARARANKEAAERAMPNAVPWTDKLAWSPEVAIQAASFQAAIDPWVAAWGLPAIEAAPLVPKDGTLRFGKWTLCNKVLPRGAWLGTRCGRKSGRVCFDGPVTVPTLMHESWSGPEVMMSLTPMELWSLRAGVRYARGTVVVAGLGLGWQLVQVAARRKVERIVVVEHSQELADVVMPVVRRIGNWLAGKVEVVIGDARKLVPDIDCDVVLTDIDSGCGGNYFVPCPKAKRVWTWGAA